MLPTSAGGAWGRWIAGAVAAIVLAVLIAVGAVALTGDDGGNERAVSGGSESGSERSTGTGGAGTGVSQRSQSPRRTTTTTTATTALTTTTAPTTTTDPESAARDLLAARVESDRVRAESAVVGWWVPQLSSKRLGIYDPTSGITYDTYGSILDHFSSLEQQYDDVLLLWSGNYVTFRGGDLWVLVVNETFSTPEGANAWCDRAGIRPDDCFAKLIGHSPADQTTAYRG